MPKGALGKPVGGVDLAVMSPETGEECPPARVRRRGPAPQRRRRHRRDRQPQRAGQLRGLLPTRRRRAGAAAPRLVLDRRPRLRRRRRLLLLRRPDRGLAAGRLGELRRRPGRVDHLAPPRPGRGRRLPGARHRIGRRRPGHGGARDRARQGVRPRRLRRPGCTNSPTWARSGSPATSGSRPRCPRRPRARSPRSACGREAWACDDAVWWRPLGQRRRPLHPPHRRRPEGPGRRAGRERAAAGGRTGVADCYTRLRTRRNGDQHGRRHDQPASPPTCSTPPRWRGPATAAPPSSSSTTGPGWAAPCPPTTPAPGAASRRRSRAPWP